MGWVTLMSIASPVDFTKSMELLRSITMSAPVLDVAIRSQAPIMASTSVLVEMASCFRNLKCLKIFRFEAKLVEPIINKNLRISC